MTSKTAADVLRSAIESWPEHSGNISAIARELDVDAPLIHAWLKGSRIGASYCIPIQVLSGGLVEAHQLRPDVFPAPGEVMPTHPNFHKGRRYGHARSD